MWITSVSRDAPNMNSVSVKLIFKVSLLADSHVYTLFKS